MPSLPAVWSGMRLWQSANDKGESLSDERRRGS
jgi:hypothetical protein